MRRAALVLILLAGSVWSLAPAPAAASVVPGTGCRVFPADNAWNADISTLPVHPSSATWMSHMTSHADLHPDFGASPYGIPYAVVDNTHATQSFTFEFASESDNVPYPFGSDVPVEQGSDAHALMVNKDTCLLYELFGVGTNGPGTAGSGAVFNLGSDRLRPDTWTSADAAGLPIFPGLLRWDEVQSGFVDHAIRFTAVNTDCSHLWPARHDAGTCGQGYPPMGARFRLKAGYDISGFSAQTQVVLRAMQHYGLILADNGSDWFFQGATDPNWPDQLISELKTVPAAQFEAVDASSRQLFTDSANYGTCLGAGTLGAGPGVAAGWGTPMPGKKPCLGTAFGGGGLSSAGCGSSTSPSPSPAACPRGPAIPRSPSSSPPPSHGATPPTSAGSTPASTPAPTSTPLVTSSTARPASTASTWPSSVAPVLWSPRIRQDWT